MKTQPNLQMQAYLYTLALKRGLPYKVLPSGAIKIMYPRTDKNLSSKLGEQLQSMKRVRVCNNLHNINK
jgi:hypothetical protein